ncbi:head GIN domain-containing protein [Catalinimonas niigatensis]|uniref:head GIN domain-containing protein n=1 Tax=Catalinimonas niigatensis TaxID=1397264 RepID=UPI002665CFBA|nr:head GIN domain-containing protein [Catalinimonas niigatensis]WPP50081.1 head GIN domain-containing protein [Catalinimonas niigatensis]
MISLSIRAQSVEQRNIADFDRIIFEGRGDLILTIGSAPALEVEAEDGVNMQRIKTYVQGKTLHITYERDDDKVWDMHPKIMVYVSFRELDEIATAGIVNVRTDSPIKNRSFRFGAEGMGKSYLEVEVDQLEVKIAGTADVELTGTARQGSLLLDGTGKLDALAMEASRIDAEVNGTGSLFVHATESLHVEANGFGAQVKYKGNPEDKVINKSGWVSIKQVSSR